MKINSINYLEGKDVTEFYITIDSNNEYIHARIRAHGDLSNAENEELISAAKVYLTRVIDPTEYLHDMSSQQHELKNLIEQSRRNIKSMSDVVNQFVLFSNLTDEQMEGILNNYPILEVGDTAQEGMVYNITGTLYKAIKTVRIDDENWLGNDSLFTKFIPEDDGEGQEIIGDWVQPQGSHDAYHIGDKVIFEGTVYESTIDNNTWSPTDYPQGWEVVE